MKNGEKSDGNVMHCVDELLDFFKSGCDYTKVTFVSLTKKKP